MKAWGKILKVIFVIAVLALAFFICKYIRNEKQCLANLKALAGIAYDQAIPGGSTPKSFEEMKPKDLDLAALICPHTETKIGPFSEASRWADFIYIGGLPGDEPTAIVVISPPENHLGLYGYATDMFRRSKRISKDEIRRIIEKPWIYHPNTGEEKFENFMKRDMVVRIPEKFKAEYGQSVSNSVGGK